VHVSLTIHKVQRELERVDQDAKMLDAEGNEDTSL
jgi:hypothetical protein